MLRKFLIPVGKRFVIGEVRDYPTVTWNNIARSMGLPLREIAQPVEEISAGSLKKQGVGKHART